MLVARIKEDIVETELSGIVKGLRFYLSCQLTN